ncbi:MAG: OsmC family protein [Phycisphaerales bacterium JB037]
MGAQEIVAETGEGFATRWRARGHEVVADEPGEAGGQDTGPSPVETMLGALASCTTITARMYADRKGFPMTSVRARVIEKPGEGGKRSFDLVVEVAGDALTDEQRTRIVTIAGRCPVHRMLEEGVSIRTVAG